MNTKRLYESSGKEKESRCLVLTPSTKREISHFHNNNNDNNGQLSLKLVKRQASLNRQSNAHEEIVEQLRASAEESPEPENWIVGHFQRVITKLVQSFIDAENLKKKN